MHTVTRYACNRRCQDDGGNTQPSAPRDSDPEHKHKHKHNATILSNRAPSSTISHTDSGHKLRIAALPAQIKHPSFTAVNLPGLARLPAHGVVSHRGLGPPDLWCTWAFRGM